MQVDSAAAGAFIGAVSARTDAETAGMDKEVLDKVSGFNSAHHVGLQGRTVPALVIGDGIEILS
jgi:hypothetical protein